jgi:serine/threonine protein kinase
LTSDKLPGSIGPYKIERLLNKGGMSLLYLASHPDIREPIVIKVLLPKYAENKAANASFLKEAAIIQMLTHPNIVHLYGEGEWEGGLYIAMEYIQGISLRQWLQKNQPKLKRALEIVQQIAYALCHLHAHGIIHRDLKPENILITDTGQVKVIDFGIAQLHTDPEKKGHFAGTPVYMSPEQKKNPNKWTEDSDIYALGVIAYELITGKLSHGTIDLSVLPHSLVPIIERALNSKYDDIVEFTTDIGKTMSAFSS